MKNILTAFIIIFHHIATVIVHRIRASTFMEDDIYGAAIKGTVGHQIRKVFIVHIIGKLKALQVPAFTAVRQIIDDENIVNPPFVEFLYNITAYKAGTACYDNHSFPFFTKSPIFSINPVVEYPSSNRMTSVRSAYSRPTISSNL